MHAYTQIWHLLFFDEWSKILQGLTKNMRRNGDKECANWLLSVMMDGTHIISPLGLLWGLKVLYIPQFFLL